MEDFNSRFEYLISQVGRPYEMFNDDGTYQGCFYPVQILYPDKPRYNLPSDDVEHNFKYGMNLLKKHCIPIKEEELQKGDIIATKYNDELHVAIYWEYGKIIHVFRGHELCISKINLFKNRKYYFRVILWQ